MPRIFVHVQFIFESYLKIKNVLKLKQYLAEQNILTRKGKYISKSSLYHILSNKVYLGKIIHKDKEYDGIHKPLITKELFDSVQNILEINAVERKHQTNAKSGSLLASLLYDDKGNKMSPSYSNGKNKHYRYYVSQKLKFQLKTILFDFPLFHLNKFFNFLQITIIKIKGLFLFGEREFG